MNFYFQIGPLRIRLEAEQRPADWPHVYVGRFQIPATAQPDLVLRLTTTPPPGRGRVTKIAELRRHWRLYRGTDHLRLEILDRKKFQVQQVALLSLNLQQGTLHWISLPHMRPILPARGWYLGTVMEPLIQWLLTAQLALRHRGLILHSSAAAWNDQGVLFVGPSSAGKTTMIMLMRDHAGAEVLNDERIVIWQHQGQWWVGGTPWHGELRELSSRRVPLKRFCLIKKSVHNRFHRLPAERVLPSLLPEAFLPLWNPAAMQGLLDVANRLCEEVPGGELEFTKDSRATDYIQTLLNPDPARELAWTTSIH